MNNIEEKVLKIYQKENLSRRGVIKSLALICADGIAFMGERGFKISSDEFDILITIKDKRNSDPA